MIYKVGVLGATGRMGTEVTSLLGGGFQHNGDLLELAVAVARNKKPSGIEGVEVRTLGEHRGEPVHVWIDFSRPEATVRLLEQISEPLVIGTTGFSDSMMGNIKSYATQHPVLLAPNMSPGMNLVMNLLGHIPPHLRLRYDVVISEEHHKTKKDAPSGTAIALREVLGSLGWSDITVQFMRAGATCGIHTVKLVSQVEAIEIRHEVLDRLVFAEGALLGALWLLKMKRSGLYSMNDVLEKKDEDPCR